MIYRFHDFELDTNLYELRKGGRPVDLEPQVFGVLSYLVEHFERVARKEDILAAVWGTTFVSDAALSTRIKQARYAIGDDGHTQRLIKTVHGRGYRFVGELADGDEEQAAAALHEVGPLRFCTTSDGVVIAYATSGAGPPFVKVSNWLTHIEYDEQSPVWRHLIRALSRDFTLVRYDERGCGLSDRELDDGSYSVEAWVRDVESVVDDLGLDRFPLLGISQGGPVAIAYSVAHPERVSHLVLHGTYGRGRDSRGPAQADIGRALLTLTREGWGQVNSEFARALSGRLIPNGSPEQHRWLVELQRVSASTQNATLFRRAFGAINVERIVERVSVPTLVMHSTGDQAVPFEEGRRLAASIPNAVFMPLDSDNHLILEDEPAWPKMISAIREFVGSK